MTTDKATPSGTPWILNKNNQFNNGYCIETENGRVLAEINRTDETDEANASLIVRAVNAHDALVEACKEASFCLKHCREDETLEPKIVAEILDNALTIAEVKA